jgi:hypothetical protein
MNRSNDRHRPSTKQILVIDEAIKVSELVRIVLQNERYTISTPRLNPRPGSKSSPFSRIR